MYPCKVLQNFNGKNRKNFIANNLFLKNSSFSTKFPPIIQKSPTLPEFQLNFNTFPKSGSNGQHRNSNGPLRSGKRPRTLSKHANLDFRAVHLLPAKRGEAKDDKNYRYLRAAILVPPAKFDLRWEEKCNEFFEGV